MKPFADVEQRQDKRSFLSMQFEGITRAELKRVLEDGVLRAICIPSGQSWACSYLIQLVLESGEMLQVTASSTCVEGWDEFGTVNVAAADAFADSALVATSLPVRLSIKNVSALLFANERVVVESGLILESEAGEIVVAAGELPGAMSLKATFLESEFEPQFSESAYTRVPWTSAIQGEA